VIPADGFFEWRTDGRQKRPFYITRPDRSPFLFAGLWERWQGPAAVIESATILTMPANEFLSDLHDRMPVVLDPAAAQLWLTMPADSPHWKEQLTKLFQPVSNDFWERFEVAPAVNTAKAQGPQLIQPLIPPATLF
jgi:putative SOS response-associated peptidase YedK